MPLLSSIEFGALLQYAVRDKSTAASIRSVQVRDAIKFRAHAPLLDTVAGYARDNAEAQAAIGHLFGPDVVLVPAPGHAPRAKGALWVPEVICGHLLRARLAVGVQPYLKRERAVRKAALAPAHERPMAQDHFDSLVIEGLALAQGRRLLVVDDVVTRGATLLACVSRLQAVFPRADVRGFALLRAISTGPIAAVGAPCSGTIRLQRDGSTMRTP